MKLIILVYKIKISVLKNLALNYAINHKAERKESVINPIDLAKTSDLFFHEKSQTPEFVIFNKSGFDKESFLYFGF